MMGHLGNRVSALLDGQLSAKETEDAWAHVYSCHACRDLVEREGWIKTRLAGLCGEDGGAVPSTLKGSLLSMPPHARAESCLIGPGHDRRRRTMGVVFLGGGAVGAAMVGVLALGFAPGSTPTDDRRPPATHLDTDLASTGSPTPSEQPVPVHRTSGPAERPGDRSTPTTPTAPLPAVVAGLLQQLVP